MRKIIMSIVVCVLLGIFPVKELNAQGAGPQGGDISFSLVLGKTQMIAENFISFYEINQINNVGTWNNFMASIDPPDLSFFSGNNLTSMVGVEAKYFFTPQIALRFSGSGAINSSPARDAVPAVTIGNSVVVPGFRMTEGKTLGQFFATLGGDYYFATGRERVHPYAGAQFNSAYGVMEIFDGYTGLDSSGNVITAWDRRIGEVWGLGGSIVGGVDYYIADGFFFGFEIKVASYMYTGKRLFYQAGMDAHDVGVYNTSFLAQPMVKLGFSF